MKSFNSKYKLIFSLVLLATAIGLAISIDFKKEKPTRFPVFCDMETTKGNHFLSDNNILITNSSCQTSKFSKSGKYCAKIDSEIPFGLGCSFKNLKKGNQLIISVWEKVDGEKGHLKIVNKDNKILKSATSNKSKNTKGWELITFTYELLENHNELKFFIHNESEKSAFYDDLRIELYETTKRVTLKENINITIDNKDYQKLLTYRDEAINSGIISKKLKKYIKGTLVYKNKTIPIKLRFKGDWPDHLKSNKWSFRVQVLDNYTFKGLKSFSIQSPHTRSFLKEWVMHLIFKEQDVLTTRYDFISVCLNNEALGIYACEEHFDKELLESYGRENAPILKFNEEGLWETRLNNPDNKTYFPYFEAAEIMPFKKNRTLNNANLLENFKTGSKLMLKYKSFKNPLNDIFDLKKAAKIYALYDLGKIRHSYHWHNQRFYYNPVNNKLEHIAFDCYAGIEEGIQDVIYGYSEKETFHNNIVYLTKQFFNDTIFISHYKDYLEKFSSKSFIKKIKEQYESKSDSLEKILKLEFPNYSFDINYITENAEAIRSTLKKYQNSFPYSVYDINYDYNSIKNNYFPSIGLKAKIQNKNTLVLKNFHLDSIYVIGYGDNKHFNEMKKFTSKITLSPFKKDEDFKKIKIKSEFKYLFFKPINTQEIKSIKINIWPYSFMGKPLVQ